MEKKENELQFTNDGKKAILNKIMSDYDSTSELSRLSNLAGSGKAARISDSLFQVLQAGQLLKASHVQLLRKGPSFCHSVYA